MCEWKMRRQVMLFLALAILLLYYFSSSVNAKNSEVKIANKVLQELEKNGEARVIIKLKEKKGIFGVMALSSRRKSTLREIGALPMPSGNLFLARLNKTKLAKLLASGIVESISYDYIIRAMLQESTNIVNATSSWLVRLNGTNITGEGETICLLDTGVNFSHPDLQGKNVTCVIDCLNVTRGCIENCSLADDNGHGTHVAGIIAANGTIKGVAPGAKLIAMKILNATGEGQISNAKIAIDWCVTHASQYNITVISMSLGTPEALFDNYCDSNFPDLTNEINTAIANNISIIAATGNNGNYTHIVAPACIENVTAVGAGTKNDMIWPQSNRNNITDLLAPGENINSTASTGSYDLKNGTSMATPHVAGAFALLHQFYRLQKNASIEPQQAEQALKENGKTIYDPDSGLNFSRIDIFSALVSLDETAPQVWLVEPENQSIYGLLSNVTFTCNASDEVGLKNITLRLWNSSTLYYSKSKNISGFTNETSFNVTEMSAGDYKWQCIAYDIAGNKGTSVNFSLTIAEVATWLVAPANNSFTNETINITCQSKTKPGTNLTNVTLMLWNSTGLAYNITQDISGTEKITNFTINFSSLNLPEYAYVWNCLSYNNESSSSFASKNFTLTYDITSPNATLVSPENASTWQQSNSVTFRFNASDNFLLNYCSIFVDHELKDNISIGESSGTYTTTVSLGNGQHNWSVQCCDKARNCNTSATWLLTVNYQPINGGGSSGGSASTASSRSNESEQNETRESIIWLSKTNLQEVAEIRMKQGEKVLFEFSGENHSIYAKTVLATLVVLTINSTPSDYTLYIGDEIKVKLDNDNFYDLWIKLENIENGKAVIKIRLIHEQEKQEKAEEEAVNKTENITEKGENTEENASLKIVRLLLNNFIVILVIIIAFLVITALKQSKKKRVKKSENIRIKVKE